MYPVGDCPPQKMLTAVTCRCPRSTTRLYGKRSRTYDMIQFSIFPCHTIRIRPARHSRYSSTAVYTYRYDMVYLHRLFVIPQSYRTLSKWAASAYQGSLTFVPLFLFLYNLQMLRGLSLLPPPPILCLWDGFYRYQITLLHV